MMSSSRTILRIIVSIVIIIPTFVYGQKFTGHVYQIAESFLDDKCAVHPECDCCSSDLIFLTDSQFAMIGRCIYNDVYHIGTYSVKDDKLILQFKQTIVSEIIDEDTNETTNRRQYLKIDPIKFTITKCGLDRIRLNSNGDATLKNGSVRPVGEEREVVKSLKEKMAWQMITGSKP